MSRGPDPTWVYYSTCDEDAATELRALEVSPLDHVLTVTGSGRRSLSLLTRDPTTLTSVDVSAGQNHLLELKLAAIRTFDYDELLGFLGVEEHDDRLKALARLRPELSDAAYRFFVRHAEKVRTDLVFSGRHERIHTRLVAPWMRLRYGSILEDVLAATTLAEQRTHYERMNTWDWRWLVGHAFSERALQFMFRDAGYAITVDVDDVDKYVLQRFDHPLRNHRLRGNDWLTFMLTGRYHGRSALPHYLHRDNYDAIRAAMTVLDVRTGDLGAVPRGRPMSTVDKFSPSDVTSCVTPHAVRRARHGRLSHSAARGRPVLPELFREAHRPRGPTVASRRRPQQRADRLGQRLHL